MTSLRQKLIQTAIIGLVISCGNFNTEKRSTRKYLADVNNTNRISGDSAINEKKTNSSLPPISIDDERYNKGRALYDQYCITCHKPFDIFEHRSISKESFMQAFVNIIPMTSLKITQEEKEDIFYALNYTPPEGSLPSLELAKTSSALTPLANRKMIASTFTTLFRDPSSTSATMAYVDKIIHENIVTRPAVFSGPCWTSEVCENESVRTISYDAKLAGSPSVSILSQGSALRRGYIIRTCEEIISQDEAINYFLSQANIDPTMEIDSSSLEYAVLKFYPDFEMTAALTDKFLGVRDLAKNNNLNLLDQWRFILQGLCESPYMERISETKLNSEIQAFSSCYKKISDSAPQLSPQLSLVKNGSKSGIEACIDVLNKAKFTAMDNTKIQDINDDEAKRVLRTFHNLHASWYSIKETPPNLTPDGRWKRSIDLMDQSSPAFFNLKALFDDQTNVDSIILSKKQLRAQRTDNNPQIILSKSFSTTFPANSMAFGDQTILAPRGELLGVQDNGVNVLTYSTARYDGEILGQQTVNGTYEFNKNWGAGAIGDPMYLIYTIDENVITWKADGGDFMPRKWAKSVYNDILCRELPVVRSEDAAPYVRPNSKVVFRQQNGCTSCHVSMDRMASVIRNFRYIGFSYNSLTHSVSMPEFHAQTKPAESEWPETSDPEYAHRPPSGYLYYRNHQGELIDKKVDSLTALAEEIVKQDDYYLCIAKRYYEYFMDVQMKLDDPGASSYVTPTDDMKIHYDNVESLAKDLKIHKDPMKTVTNILWSAYKKAED